MANPIRNVFAHHDIGEPLATLFLESATDALLGRLGFAVHLGKVALQRGEANSET